MLLMLSCLVAQFVVSNQWARMISLETIIAANMWVASGRGSFKEAYMAVNNTDLCARSGQYDYSWDKTNEWSFRDHICIPTCDFAAPEQECVWQSETNYLENDHEVFFVTEYTEFANKRNGTGVLETRQSYFTPFEDAFSIGLAYRFHLREKDTRDLTLGWARQVAEGSSHGGVPVLVLDHQDAVMYRLIPDSDGIELTLRKLLKMANVENWLSSFQDPALFGQNQLEGYQLKGPLGRISGLPLELRLYCYNGVAVPNWLRVPSDLAGQVFCTLQADASHALWSRKEVNSIHQQLMPAQFHRHLYMHGVRVRLKVGGEVAFVSFNSILNTLVNIFVLLRIPKVAVLLLTTVFLGHLSTIYKKVIKERFNLGQQVGGMASRLLSNSVTFLELEKTSKGIPKSRMAEQFRDSLKNCQEMDENEIAALVDFCFNAVTQRGSASQREDFGHEARKVLEDLGSTGFIRNSLHGVDEDTDEDDEDDDELLREPENLLKLMTLCTLALPQTRLGFKMLCISLIGSA